MSKYKYNLLHNHEIDLEKISIFIKTPGENLPQEIILFRAEDNKKNLEFDYEYIPTFERFQSKSLSENLYNCIHEKVVIKMEWDNNE